MGKQHGGSGVVEPVARLSDEQWNALKAALDGEIADLKAEAAPLRAALKGRCCTVEIDGGGNATHEPNCPLSDAGKGWVSPDKVAEARRQVCMIDASPAGSLNAQCKIAALDALKGVE